MPKLPQGWMDDPQYVNSLPVRSPDRRTATPGRSFITVQNQATVGVAGSDGSAPKSEYLFRAVAFPTGLGNLALDLRILSLPLGSFASKSCLAPIDSVARPIECFVCSLEGLMTSPQDVAVCRSAVFVEPLLAVVGDPLALVGDPLALVGSTISFVCATLSLAKVAPQLLHAHGA